MPSVSKQEVNSNLIQRNISLLGFYSLFSAIGVGLTNPVLQPFALSFLPNISSFGTLLTLANGFSLIFVLLGGFIADANGRRASVNFGNMLSILGMVAIFLSSSWIWILFGLLFSQAGQVTIIAGNSAATAESAKRGSTGVAFGITNTIRQLGVMLGPILGGYLWEITGDPRLVFLTSIISYLFCVPVILGLKETRREKKRFNFSLSQIREGIKQLPDPNSLLYLYIVQIIIGFGLGMSRQLRILYLYEVILASPLEVSWLLGISGFVALLLLLPIGRLTDRIGRIPILVSYEVLQIGLTIFQAFVVDPRQLIFIGVLDGLAMAMMIPTFRSLQSELMPGDHRARLWGFFQFIGALAAFPAAAVGGFIWELFGGRAMFMISALVAIPAPILVALKVRDTVK